MLGTGNEVHELSRSTPAFSAGLLNPGGHSSSGQSRSTNDSGANEQAQGGVELLDTTKEICSRYTERHFALLCL